MPKELTRSQLETMMVHAIALFSARYGHDETIEIVAHAVNAVGAAREIGAPAYHPVQEGTDPERDSPADPGDYLVDTLRPQFVH